MQKIFKKKIPAFQFHLLQKFDQDMDHAVFSSSGGFSASPFDSLNVSFEVGDSQTLVQDNRNSITDSFGLPAEALFSAHQTHGKNVLVIDEKILSRRKAGLEFADTDAFVTNLKDVLLFIKVADCQAIVLFDPIKKVIAAVHAGWRGLVQDVAGETLKVMVERFGVHPEHVLAGIAPSLGPCCAYFSDPEKELPPSFKAFIDSRKRVDLWGYSAQKLESRGIPREQIEQSRVCTCCGGGGKYFSFRRDRGVTGRFGVGICLRSM